MKTEKWGQEDLGVSSRCSVISGCDGTRGDYDDYYHDYDDSNGVDNGYNNDDASDDDGNINNSALILLVKWGKIIASLVIIISLTDENKVSYWDAIIIHCFWKFVVHILIAK